jgi:hypothetical protein
MCSGTPAQRLTTPAAQKPRAGANAQRRREQRAFESAAVDQQYDVEWFRIEAPPGLGRLTLTAIAKAAGLSTSTVSKWRAASSPFPALAALMREQPDSR